MQNVHHEAPDIGGITAIALFGFFMSYMSDDFRPGVLHRRAGFMKSFYHRNDMRDIRASAHRTASVIVRIVAMDGAQSASDFLDLAYD